MTYATVMVSLALDRTNEAPLEAAGQIAERFDAGIVGIAAAQFSPPLYFTSGDQAQNLIDQGRASVVKRIAELYAIESGVRGEPAQERQRVRHEQSRPLVEAMHVWLNEQLGRIPGASTLAKAIRYALNHWNGLVIFLEDGRLELDTNTVERAIRPVTITRKNSLFAGNDNGGRHWAIIATLVQSAKLNGVEPLAWLTDVLERIVSGRTKRHELETLLPWNWKAAREAEAAQSG